MECSIREAQFSDLKEIRELVCELAVFERAPDAVTASLADYQRLFKEHLFECLVAETDGKIIGICLYYAAFSTWKGKMMYLEDLIVTKAYRGQGVGKLLLEAFLQKSEQKQAVLAKWQVLDWNTDAIDFYEKMGALVEKGWWNVKKGLTNG